MAGIIGLETLDPQQSILWVMAWFPAGHPYCLTNYTMLPEVFKCYLESMAVCDAWSVHYVRGTLGRVDMILL